MVLIYRLKRTRALVMVSVALCTPRRKKFRRINEKYCNYDDKNRSNAFAFIYFNRSNLRYAILTLHVQIFEIIAF